MDLGQGRRGLAGTWKPRRAAATPGLRVRAASDGAGGACEKFLSLWESDGRRSYDAGRNERMRASCWANRNRVFFICENFLDFAIVALSFICHKYCLIID
jgi:hypothetical protein